MWIFLPDSFLSVVADRRDPRKLLVRARVQGDIERVFPEMAGRGEVEHTPSADYPYRASLPWPMVVRAISDRLGAIRYDNFKRSVLEGDRHSAYAGVWFEMRGFQERRENRRRSLWEPDDDPDSAFFDDALLDDGDADSAPHDDMVYDGPDRVCCTDDDPCAFCLSRAGDETV